MLISGSWRARLKAKGEMQITKVVLLDRDMGDGYVHPSDVKLGAACASELSTPDGNALLSASTMVILVVLFFVLFSGVIDQYTSKLFCNLC